VIPGAFAGRLHTLARLLFPSWAFFDIHASPPSLEIRRSASNGDGGAWRPAFAAPDRRWWHVLFNPLGTQVLWYQTQIERFCASLSDDDDQHAEAHAAALTVRAIAEHCVLARWPHERMPGWQYRVVIAAHDRGSPTVVFESVMSA
jgi:hypothetical protein